MFTFSKSISRSYLTILGNIECPMEPNVTYSSTMFEVVKNVYQGDLLLPYVFGSLGTIAGKNRNLKDKRKRIILIYWLFEHLKLV